MTLAHLLPLAHHLWQSTLFVALIALLAFALRKNPARVRYWLWFAASLKFLIPFSLLVDLGTALEWNSIAAIAPPEVSAAVVDIGQRVAMPAASLTIVPQVPSRIPVVIFSIWLCGVGVSIAAWLRAWLWTRRAVRTASPFTPLDTIAPTPIKLLCTPMLMEPGVVGIFQPVLLMPKGITDRLPLDQLKAIFLHEMSHARARDNLTAAIHLVVETVFWFYPLVRWIRKPLIDERERACDEAVLHVIDKPDVYAQGILNVCRFYHEPPMPCSSGVTGSNLQKRIEAIIRNDKAVSLSGVRRLLLGGIAIVIIVGPVAAGAIGGLRRVGQSVPLSTNDLSFEVVSVKPNAPGDLPRGNSFNLQSGRFRGRNQTLKWFIGMAYAPRAALPPLPLPDERIMGGPDWMDKERFTIEATAGRPVTASEMAAMLRRLLQDRFGLKVRKETEIVAVYELVRANTDAKAQPTLRASEGCDTAAREGIGGGPGRLSLRCAPIPLLAEVLSEIVDRPVIDNTGLTELYDANLEFQPTEAEILSIFGGERPPEASVPAPSIFTVLQERLGLKLVAQRGPVDTLVIVDAQRPEEN